jgi:NAD(P)-dependent dehydrogenase (short-subunit alcohol dehydrogenase family)
MSTAFSPVLARGRGSSAQSKYLSGHGPRMPVDARQLAYIIPGVKVTIARQMQAKPRFQERLKREVPLGRLVSAEEDARFATYLCSDVAACFVGQVFPVTGGWANR